MSSLGLSPRQNPDPLPTAAAAARAEITASLHRGASWLFLIAGLSLVNTVILISGSNWMFLGGLGATEFAAAVAMQKGSSAALVAIFVNIWAAGFFACLGYFARKGQKWAFITGMVLYAVDVLPVLLLQLWLMLLFHGFVLYRLYNGYSSCNHLHAFQKTGPDTLPPTS